MQLVSRAALFASPVLCGYLACTSYAVDAVNAADGGIPGDAQVSADGAVSADGGTLSDGGTQPGDSGSTNGPKCDPDGAFSAAVPLTTLPPPQMGLLTGYSFTADELRVYVSQGGTLFTGTRASITANFGNFQVVPVPAPITHVRHPVISRNGDRLFFAGSGGPGTAEKVRMATLTGPTSLNVFTVADDTAGALRFPAPIPNDPNNHFFAVAGNIDSIAVGELLSVVAGTASPVVAPTIYVSAPVFSADGTRMYVAYTTIIGGSKTRVVGSMASGGGGSSIWSSPTPLPSLGTPSPAFPAWLSSDNCRLYLTSGTSEGGEPYVATRTPK